MDIFWLDTVADGIEVDETEISLEEFDGLFGHEAGACSED